MKIAYWIIFAVTLALLCLAFSIWFSLVFGPDQGLGGVGSAIAIMILLVLDTVLAMINFFVGKKIHLRGGSVNYKHLALGVIIFLAASPFIEALFRRFL